MKVNDAALQQVLRAYSPKQTGESSSSNNTDAGASVRGDEVTLSSEGQELQRAIRAAQQVEDVRSERVDQIRTQIRTGQYLLDPQKIASKMLGLGDGE
ncbi:MAG: flagellar biosynthesis anti-sigma factor FlgM [Chloroflexi bacterium]|nr:flagellar biosynthesis anti-sigma factor FlgM [Chloroflexota bacterium]